MKGHIDHVSVHSMDIALKEPFGIATGAQVLAENVFVRVHLDDGTVGTGEAAPFPAVNGETRAQVLASLSVVTPRLTGQSVLAWRTLAPQLRELTPSARCAVETAILDAWARFLHVPLWSFFGGAQTELRTDLTITTGTPEHAARAAADIAAQDYDVIKLKVGGRPVEEDVDRLRQVTQAAPSCGLILDANGGYSSADDVLTLVTQATRVGARVLLLEQPLHRDNHRGLQDLVARSPVPVAADEGANSLQDVIDVAQHKRAHVVNIKITKSGVLQGLEMMHAARALGLQLMMGAMVESAVCTSMSACMAAGWGGFGFIDLDTPLWMLNPPTTGGYEQRGPVLDLAAVTEGHGAAFAPGPSAG